MEIIRTNRYLKDLKRLRVTKAEAEAIDEMIAAAPQSGDVIKGLEGIRKIRFGLRNKGKSGGGRTIYLLMVSDDVVVLLTAYAKNEKPDLTSADRKAILAVLKELKKDD